MGPAGWTQPDAQEPRSPRWGGGSSGGRGPTGFCSPLLVEFALPGLGPQRPRWCGELGGVSTVSSVPEYKDAEAHQSWSGTQQCDTSFPKVGELRAKDQSATPPASSSSGTSTAPLALRGVADFSPGLCKPSCAGTAPHTGQVALSSRGPGVETCSAGVSQGSAPPRALLSLHQEPQTRQPRRASPGPCAGSQAEMIPV